MSIEGSVRTFPAADLLEWLGRRRRTGSLSLGRRELVRSLGVDGGEVVWASSNRAGDALSQVLRARQIIDDAGLEAAAAREVEAGCMLGQALVDAGVLSADEVRGHLADQIREAVCDVVGWSDGWFRFVPEVRERRPRLQAALAIDELLELAVPEASDWGALSEVWLEGGRLVRVPGADAGALGALIDELGEQATVAEVTTRAAASRFETLRELARQMGAKTIVGAVQQARVEARSRAAEIAELSRELLGSYRVPRRLEGAGELELDEPERYLLGRVDGCWDLFSLVSSSRLGEIETLMTFKRLSDRGAVAL